MRIFLVYNNKYNIPKRKLKSDTNWNCNMHNIKLKSEGFLSIIYTFEGNYFSEGLINKGSLDPKNYTHFWKTKKTTKEMGLFFENNKIVSLNQKPFEKENLRLDIFKIENTKDPLSSFIQILKGAETSLVVDGRRFYTMSAVNLNDVNQISINLDNYSNLWADHKRSKFEKIAFEVDNEDLLPNKIYIYFDGRVFIVEEI